MKSTPQPSPGPPNADAMRRGFVAPGRGGNCVRGQGLALVAADSERSGPVHLAPPADVPTGPARVSVEQSGRQHGGPGLHPMPAGALQGDGHGPPFHATGPESSGPVDLARRPQRRPAKLPALSALGSTRGHFGMGPTGNRRPNNRRSRGHHRQSSCYRRPSATLQRFGQVHLAGRGHGVCPIFGPI